LEMPSTEMVNNKRVADFKQKITDTMASDELAFMRGVIEQYRMEHDVPSLDIAAALAQMAMGDQSLQLKVDEKALRASSFGDEPKGKSKSRKDRNERRQGSSDRGPRDRPQSRSNTAPDADKERFRIEVGHDHGVKPGNIVGAIANEAGLDGEHIGQIDINDGYTLVDLPKGMPNEIFKDLAKTRVCGQALKITKFGKGGDKSESRSSDRKPASGKRPSGQPGGKKRSDGKGFGGGKSAGKKPGGPKRSAGKKPAAGAKRGPKPGGKKA
jgi:ATP-dependent RNA helicase DeaD